MSCKCGSLAVAAQFAARDLRLRHNRSMLRSSPLFALRAGTEACRLHVVQAPRRTQMPQQVQEIMAKQLHSVPTNTSLLEVARLMRDQRIGDVLVTNPDGTLRGIVTDRDIVVRADAQARPLDKTKVGDICSDKLVKVAPTATLDEAVKMMRDYAVRRVAVVSNGKAIGVVSLGDLARHKEPNSALAQISSAPPND
jgi:CBS domain-containing protein